MKGNTTPMDIMHRIPEFVKLFLRRVFVGGIEARTLETYRRGLWNAHHVPPAIVTVELRFVVDRVLNILCVTVLAFVSIDGHYSSPLLTRFS